MEKVDLKTGKAIIVYKFNKNGRVYYKLKCDICGEYFELRHDHLKNKIGCNKCSTIGVKRPELLDFFSDSDKDIVKNMKLNSKKYFNAICPKCGNVKNISIANLNNNGFSCEHCSDNIPFGERFVKALLESVGVDNIFQLNKTTFKWCGSYKYDFYIPKYNCIIETHGLQHYRDCSWGKKQDVQENDRLKQELALKNGISEYIIIDCRKSEMEWIKSNLLNSTLNEVLDLSNVDWNKCQKDASKSYLYEFCEYWNNKSKSLEAISDYFGVSAQLVRRYLKIGRDISICDYDENAQKSHKGIHEKKCICLTTNKIYNSLNEASLSTGVSVKSISNCCTGRSKSAGNMIWELLDK